ncbi:restriction endonuclease subunit S [Xanthomonas sp. 3075]|uniref:restriction endonuclease subunit S n=1 Tax=Xanthomonas sp. 3075 TaxID=3035315 RepID=UPI001619AD37|nr:restriction endonuclease subunit S [Xanthomonas sp. 3075]MBB4130427.1 type I restriction enzyme S subunit [Xanthomonas sp. 3075]
MRFRKLSEIAPSGASPAKPAPDETVWHLTLDQIESGSGKIWRRSYGPASDAGTSTFVFDTGNVLYSKLRPYLNKVICPDSSGIATTELVPLRPIPGELNREFLCFYLRSPEFVSWASAQVDGAKMPRMKMKSFWAHEMPLPPIDDQIRIAHLLGRVEGLIAQRKQHLQQLDDLLKSVFLEMFGDPVRNEKSWKIGSLGSYGSFKNGLNFGKGESGVTVRYLGVGDFKSKAALDDFDSLGFIELNELPASDYFLHDGDLLFVRSNGNRELVGRCMAVYPGKERATYSGFCIRYRITDASLLAIYVAHLFRSAAFRRVLFQGGQGANIQNINQQILSGLPIPIPDEGLQNQFAAIVEKVEALKSGYQQSLTDLESLYGALSQQAFKGELDLSRVVLPAAPIEGESPVASSMPAPITTPVIELPETDLLQPALQDPAKLAPLLCFWLEAYRTQLGRAAFSLERFIAAALARLGELHPDNDFEWAASDYEPIKTWAFEALAAGALTQAFDDDGNRIELKASAEQSLA